MPDICEVVFVLRDGGRCGQGRASENEVVHLADNYITKVSKQENRVVYLADQQWRLEILQVKNIYLAIWVRTVKNGSGSETLNMKIFILLEELWVINCSAWLSLSQSLKAPST